MLLSLSTAQALGSVCLSSYASSFLYQLSPEQVTAFLCLSFCISEMTLTLIPTLLGFEDRRVTMVVFFPLDCSSELGHGPAVGAIDAWAPPTAASLSR